MDQFPLSYRQGKTGQIGKRVSTKQRKKVKDKEIAS